MKKIKLPRKRKKNYLKNHRITDYMALIILSEILFETGKKHYDRFYTYAKCNSSKQFPNGLKPIKRW